MNEVCILITFNCEHIHNKNIYTSMYHYYNDNLRLLKIFDYKKIRNNNK